MTWGPVLRAAALVALDGIWLGQGIVTFFVAAWLFLVRLPMSFLPRHAAVRPERLRNLGIYAVATFIVLGLCALNAHIGAQRAKEVVAAVEAFKAKTGDWPRQLAELVPAYLPEIPRARYTLTMSDFQYHTAGGNPMLMYTAMPPYGRPFYSFRQRRWGYLD